ncbi:MAG: histidine phosphatase family protein [Huintestinicola sp.]|uniref:histidine phosphatase family protein n=1 Tax=Huintestinicola sp. TaxID=2981661 RepID=UPI003F1138CB
MTRLIFIRHGKTGGNLRGAYIGRTDEPLCDEGKSELEAKMFPEADIVISSPMKRCVQTADIIYNKLPIRIYDNLRECDFGDFEGKNYSELNGNADYQAWIDSGGTMQFPNGEGHTDFTDRCCRAFLQAVSENEGKTIAFIVHGGTIMSVLERFAEPKKGYYDYMVKNGCGFLTEFSDGSIRAIKEI